MTLSRRAAATALVCIVLLAVLVALLAPRERTLGSGIRSVYLHVSATWAGLSGFFLLGALGLVLLFWPNRRLGAWVRSIGWAAVMLFAVGYVLSLVAARVNWGGVLWQEPRVRVSFEILIGAAAVLMANLTALDQRWKGVLWVVLITFASWRLQSTQMYFHPEAPIRTSPSLAIKLSFYGLFVLALMAGASIVALMHSAADDKT